MPSGCFPSHYDNDSTDEPKKTDHTWAVFWVAIATFVLLQNFDMFVTGKYIGDDWRREVCPMMSWMIKSWGIGTAIWWCRLASAFLVCGVVGFRRIEGVRVSFAIMVLFYFLQMLDWVPTVFGN